MSATGKDRLRCPNCHESRTLYENVEVPGWRSLDEFGVPVEGTGFSDREAEWDDARPDGFVGCGECQWEGHRRELERVDMYGEPLPKPPTVSPFQTTLGMES